MEKSYDLSPETFAEFRHRPLAYRVLRSNGWISALGPLYLLWRGEWKSCLLIYLPMLLASTAAFGLMGLGAGSHHSEIYQAGVAIVGLCLLWVFAWNNWLDLRWNDRPHPQQRALLPAALWLAATLSLPLSALQLGCMLGRY